jgi:hypothetical protein
VPENGKSGTTRRALPGAKMRVAVDFQADGSKPQRHPAKRGTMKLGCVQVPAFAEFRRLPKLSFNQLY